jgi:hypothetical protein
MSSINRLAIPAMILALAGGCGGGGLDNPIDRTLAGR